MKPKPKAGIKNPTKKKGKINPKALRDPGARSKIPINQLPARYKAMRLANLQNKTPIAENSPYTYGMLRRDRSAAEQLEFAPKESELKSALLGSKQRQGAITSWFDNYRQQLGGAAAASNQFHQQAVADNQARAQQSEAQAAQRRQQQEQTMREDAAKRGMEAQPLQDDTQAAASRMALQNAFSGMLTNANAANQQYFAGRQGVAGASQINERLRENQYAQGIEGKQQELAGLKGAWRTEFDNKARQREQEYGLARGALGIKDLTAKGNIQNQRGQRQIARKKIRSDVKIKRMDQQLKSRQLSEQKRHNIEQERAARIRSLKKGSGGTEGGRGRNGSLTDVQKRMYNNQFMKGLDMLRAEPPRGKPDAQILTVLNRSGVDAGLSRALLDWYKNKGTLSPQSASILDKFSVPFKRSRIRRK